MPSDTHLTCPPFPPPPAHFYTPTPPPLPASAHLYALAPRALPKLVAVAYLIHHKTSNVGVLQDTHRTLMPAKQSATNGHVTLLKQKMLTAILRRLDCVLFEKLTAGIRPTPPHQGLA